MRKNILILLLTSSCMACGDGNSEYAQETPLIYAPESVNTDGQQYDPALAQMKAEHCRKARENYNKCMDDARSMISESMRLATMATCKGFLDACR